MTDRPKKNARKNSTKNPTRERLIEAAGELFAEKGFKETTVRDICDRAEANVAAVNYHFGDKERLHEEVMLYIINGIKENFPIDRGLDGEESAEARLSIFIRNMLYRFADPARPAWQGVLLAQERMNPRPAILSVMHEEISKGRKLLFSLIEELLGPDADIEHVELCDASIVGQLMFQAHVRSPHAHPMFRREGLSEAEFNGIVRHITDFSLAGMERVRKMSEESAEK
jgi:AcrR family transcriptional regulator